jgi:hypothetical protein
VSDGTKANALALDGDGAKVVADAKDALPAGADATKDMDADRKPTPIPSGNELVPIPVLALITPVPSDPLLAPLVPRASLAPLAPPSPLAPIPSDRPTPRSTVLPNLPERDDGPSLFTLGRPRPPLETLIFHGAPPLPPPSPRRFETPAPSASALEGPFQDVLSAELLEEVPDEPSTALAGGGESARTDRPPSFALPLRSPLRLPREGRVLAAIGAAIAIPVVVAIALDRPSARPPLATTPPPPPAATSAAPTAPARAPGTCVVDRSSHLLARRALVRGGVEAAALGDRVAFATLTSSKSGTAIELDPRTLGVKGSAKVVTGDVVRHVVPELADEGPVDVQADTGDLRSLSDAEGDAAIGVREGFLVWGPRDGDGITRLWKLPWPASVDAPRVAAVGTGGERVVAFRRVGAVWAGSFRGGQVTSDLARLSTGASVGVPAMDSRGDDVVIAWAQRDSAASAWGVRWARWAPRAGGGPVHALTIPPGGPGDRAMAPSVSMLDGGRILLAWTEAGHGKNEVRAEVFDSADHVIGDVIDVSPVDSVAGQQQVALTDDAHGAVAYLVAKRGAFELRATAIDCATQ